MSYLQRMKWMIVSAAALSLGACSVVPEELKVSEQTNLVNYQQALAQPQTVIGQTARWGGAIADVRNSDSGTIIEVVNFDLIHYGRPHTSDESDGRFLAVIDKFVDPLVYKKGRFITFVGQIETPQEGKIDEYKYLFPTLDVTGMKLWKEKRESNVEIDYSPAWWRHSFYGPYPYHYPAPVIIRSHDGGRKTVSDGGGARQNRQ